MIVTVTAVPIPAMSTVGYATGSDDHGRVVEFAGDHRPMRDIGYALSAGEDVRVELPPWAITGMTTPSDPKES
ncbi:MAG: hypothetical protein WCH74_07275 [Chloroflexota bacterium]